MGDEVEIVFTLFASRVAHLEQTGINIISRQIKFLLLMAAIVAQSGCAIVTVAGAAVTVVATGVKLGAAAVETTVDVATAGVKAATGSDDN